MSQAQIEVLVKARDGHRMIAEALDEYLQTLAPPGVHKYDLEKIRWTDAEGSNGKYQRSDDVNSADFKELLKDLGAHDGKMTIGQHFVWVFQNGATVGRKARKK